MVGLVEETWNCLCGGFHDGSVSPNWITYWAKKCIFFWSPCKTYLYIRYTFQFILSLVIWVSKAHGVSASLIAVVSTVCIRTVATALIWVLLPRWGFSWQWSKFPIRASELKYFFFLPKLVRVQYRFFSLICFPFPPLEALKHIFLCIMPVSLKHFLC